MRVITVFLLIFVLGSCGLTRTAHNRSGHSEPLGSLLEPLQYANSKQSLRIWFQDSRSYDLIYAITSKDDSSSFGYRVELGEKHSKRNKTIDHFSHSSWLPQGGVNSFFTAWNGLNPFQFKNQPKAEFEFVYDSPSHFIIVEYTSGGQYTIFRFQKGATAYRAIEDFLNSRQIIGQ